MDKVKIIATSLLALVVVGILFLNGDKIDNKINKNFVSISFKELQKKVDKKEDFVLVITQKGCSHCEAYEPVVKKIANKYDIKIYNLSLTGLTKDENAKLSAIASTNGTPTTIFFKDGEEESTINRIVGEASQDKLTKKLKKLGYIGE